MAFTRELQVRFPEVDFARVVYYPRFFDYAHQVFEDFFADEVKVPYPEMLTVRKVGYPSVHVEADFKAPLRFGDRFEVVLAATRVSDRSVACAYRFTRLDGRVHCATLKVVTASVDMDRFAPVPMPAEVRSAFERHLQHQE